MNPYLEELDDTFRGKYVRIITDEGTYEGYARIFNYNDGEVILHGAMKDGDHIGSVAVSEYTAIEQTDAPELLDVPVDSLVESPYSAREYSDSDLDEYARDLRMRGALYSFPTARPHGEAEYQLIGGHRRTRAAKRAGFETIPVRIISLTDWEALQQFVDEHIPLSEHELNDGSDEHRGWYSREEINRSIEQMQRQWDIDELNTIPALQTWLVQKPTLDGSTQRITRAQQDSQSDPRLRGPSSLPLDPNARSQSESQ